ncbi:hypothetical protein [Actinoplanes sp. NPDC049599]|uniref:hypothetical protein n=1 Tax=Actinoplanes sp. NPDC049599 TaxID=3363903 RepID=UPI0037937DDB
MVPLTLKVPVPFDYVFPSGVLCLGVDAAVDFDRLNEPDNQARDKETGERMWVVRVMDLDPAAGKFGRTTEVKVKVIAPHAPVPLASAVPGYPPSVEFDGLTLTPYVDSQRCKSTGTCMARMAYSLRATAIRPAGALAAAA